MAKAKIAITLSEEALAQMDRLVKDGVYANRSQAIEAAVADKIARLGRVRLAQESAKLDPAFEREMAEEGFVEDASGWPEY